MNRILIVLILLLVLSNAKCGNGEEVELFGCPSAEDLIKKHEGLRMCEYKDTMGHPTVCYGFNLDRVDARSKIESVRGDFNKVYAGGCLSQGQCDTLLGGDIATAEGNEKKIFGSVCECVRNVLIDMTFNLGYPKMRGFTEFIGLIKAETWKSAGEDLKTTLWCRQVGRRCSEDVEQIESGCIGSGMSGEFGNNSSHVQMWIHF